VTEQLIEITPSPIRDRLGTGLQWISDIQLGEKAKISIQ
jgi:hypothetical protein